MDSKAMHVMLDLWGIEVPYDSDEIVDILEKAAEVSRSTVVGKVKHKFEPQGMSVVLLLAESHISYHSFPEDDYCAIDIYTCGNTDAKAAAEYIILRLKPTHHQIKEIVRGVKVP